MRILSLSMCYSKWCLPIKWFRLFLQYRNKDLQLLMDRLFFVFSHFSKKAVYYLNMYNLDFLSQEKKNARESNHVYHEEFEKIKKDGNFLSCFLSISLFDAYIKIKNNKCWVLQLISQMLQNHKKKSA